MRARVGARPFQLCAYCHLPSSPAHLAGCSHRRENPVQSQVFRTRRIAPACTKSPHVRKGGRPQKVGASRADRSAAVNSGSRWPVSRFLFLGTNPSRLTNSSARWRPIQINCSGKIDMGHGAPHRNDQHQGQPREARYAYDHEAEP